MIVFIWVAFGIITALAAAARGRNFLGWLLVGLVTGIFGLIAVLVMENLKTGGRVVGVGSYVYRGYTIEHNSRGTMALGKHFGSTRYAERAIDAFLTDSDRLG